MNQIEVGVSCAFTANIRSLRGVTAAAQIAVEEAKQRFAHAFTTNNQGQSLSLARTGLGDVWVTGAR